MPDDRQLVVQRLSRKFETRYYQWSRQDAEQELDQGFPRVRRIKNLGAARFLEVVKGMAPNEQRRLVVALAKRFHRNVLNDVGESFSSEEERIVNAYLGRQFRLPSQVPRADRKALAKQTKAILTPIVGKVAPSTASTWWHESVVNGWVLRTSLDVGAKFEHLAYFHSIITPDNFSLAPNISFLSWLGITGTTSWTFEAESDQENAVQTLAELCQTFVTAAPNLLEGLPAVGSA